ncbi:MAG: stage V sporulation protein AD [Lachnospiraceae bacterium]
MCKDAIVNGCGKQSIIFPNNVYIAESAAIVGTKEGEGPLGKYFDKVLENDLFDCESWEEAESKLQEEVVKLVLQKNKIKIEEIRYIFGGDLLGQLMATNFGLKNFDIPLFGLYGACSTSGLGLGLGALTISGGFSKNCICITSSHFASAEKEFRFPLEYGNQRPLSSSWTVTGSAAFLLKDTLEEKTKAKIYGITTGKIVDYGIKDSSNMGACMAPAAADTIYQHFKDFSSKPEEYDKIITGDLGTIGSTALIYLLQEKGIDISKNHLDCGVEVFDNAQHVNAGGSGCACSATVLSSYILRNIESKKWKKILYVPTGALLSKTSFNEGKSVPGIAHAVVITNAYIS